jgi:predicted enzyme related to lactoylglutathione lyase
MTDVHGKFLWHELVTTDPSAAGAFYSRVLGWKPQPWDKNPSYTLLMAAKGPAGGAMRVPEDAPPGTQPQWLAYIGTPDIDGSLASAQRLGARVLKGATQIPDGGRYAVLADPQGAVFGMYTPSAGGSGPGDDFAWHELATNDFTAAARFYRELFGWQELRVHDMGEGGKYLLFGLNGKEMGGMYNRPAHMSGGPPQWQLYAKVASASKAADAVKAAGGRLLNGPMEVPGGSWIAQFLDPQGAALAVNEPAPAARPAPPPKPVAVKPAPPPPPKPAAPKSAAVAPAAPPKPAPPPAPKPVAAAPAARPAPAAAPSAPAAKVAPAPKKAPAKKAAKKAAKKVARKKAAKKVAKKVAKKATKVARKAKKAKTKAKAKRSAAAKRGKSAKKAGKRRGGARRKK